MFEETKVHANLAYWDIAGNYSDNAVQNAIPNGSWWLLRWYGALTGHTVRVTPPVPAAIDGLSGLAALDPGKRQARVIVANPAGGGARVALTGIDPGLFGERVRVLVQATSWTGYDGAARTPLDLSATEYPVEAGQVTVDLDAMDPMTAYQLIVSPASGNTQPAVTSPRTARYLAAEATLTGCAARQQGSAANPQGYAAAGGANVGPVGPPGSRVEFRVCAPQAPLPALRLLRERDRGRRAAGPADRRPALVACQLSPDAQRRVRVAPGPVREPERGVSRDHRRRARSGGPAPRTGR